MEVCHFNPRSHAGSDSPIISALLRGECFNPRSHAGSDRTSITPKLAKHSFNPRSHAGSDPGRSRQTIVRPRFQSTLPRGERPEGITKFTTLDDVSIHAPTRGATLKIVTREIRDENVSIHAPTRGATYLGSPEGLSDDVSIHAPTRGATKYRDAEGNEVLFQSTLPRGERHKKITLNIDDTGFNPRSHAGSDPTGRLVNAPL